MKRRSVAASPPGAARGLSSLHSGIIVKLVPLHARDTSIAFSILSAGWKDFFDAVIYATAKRLEMPLLTLDQHFASFLDAKGLTLVSHSSTHGEAAQYGGGERSMYLRSALA